MKNTYNITVNDTFQKKLVKELIGIDKKIHTKTTSISAMEGNKLDPLLVFLSGSFQSLLSMLALHTQYESLLKEFLQYKREAFQKKEALDAEASDLRERKRKRNLSGGEHNFGYLDHLFRTWSWMKVVIGFLILGELSFNYRSFQVISSNMFMGIALAFTLGLALLFLSHLLAIRLRQVKTVWRQILYWALSLFAFSSIFYLIADFRLSYMNDMGSPTSIGHFSFVALNLLFMLSAMLISYRYSPSKQQKIAFEQNNQETKEYKEQQRRLKVINEELRQIPHSISQKEQSLNQLLVFLKDQEKHIEDLYLLKTQEVILNFSLQKGESIKAPPTPKLNLQYQSLNLEDYV